MVGSSWQEEKEHRMAVWGRANALAIVVALLVSACGLPSGPTAPAPGAIASAVISGTSGGTVGLPGGAELLVPPGAVIGAAKATISKQPAPADAQSSDWPDRPLGSAYHFDLGGATLVHPVTVTLPFAAAALPDGTTPDDLVLAYHDLTAGRWVPVAATIDAAAGTVTAQVSHLSDWALWAPDWDYWLALLKGAASGDLTTLLHAITTFASGCTTTADGYTVDNSVANRMIQGCLTKTSTSDVTLEIRNLRAFALEISDPAGYMPDEPILLTPGDSVSFNVEASDMAPVIVDANMSRLGLTASVIDCVLGLLPNISAARVSPGWRAAFKEIVGTIDNLHALTDAIADAQAGKYPQAAEAAVKVISGMDFLAALVTAAHKAGVEYGVPALAQVTVKKLNAVMLVVGLGDLIVTSWSFFGDYFFNAHTEVHLVWQSTWKPPTPKPTPTPKPSKPPAPTIVRWASPDMESDTHVDCTGPESADGCYAVNVTWSWSGDSKTMMLVYFSNSVHLECTGGPCPVRPPHSSCFTQDEREVGSVAATAGKLVVLVPAIDVEPEMCIRVRSKNGVGQSGLVWANP